MADQRGGRPQRAPLPPMAQKFLNFMQFFGTFCKGVCWRSPPEGWRPLLQGILDPALHNQLLAFLRVLCKVIRIGKRVQPDISKARQQVNIDRPAYNKTDKQCRTRTTITARLPDG